VSDASLWECTHDEYHADGPKSISHSELDTFIWSPKAYHKWYVTRESSKPKSAALDMGIVFHDAVLGVREGLATDFDAFLDQQTEFTMIPACVMNAKGEKRGKPWLDFAKEHEGEILLKEQEVEPMCGWLEALVQHNKANILLYGIGVDNEHTIVWTDDATGLRLRCRLDRLVPEGFLVDVKTARSVQPRDFSKAAFDFGYHRQAAYYQDGVEELTGERLPFIFIAVEKTDPYCVECYALADEFVEQGRVENRVALEALKECRDKGVWESPTHGQITTLSAPSYARFADEWDI